MNEVICIDHRINSSNCSRLARSHTIYQRDILLNSLFEILQTLYWSAYGLIDLTNLDLEYPHVFTEFVGKLYKLKHST